MTTISPFFQAENAPKSGRFSLPSRRWDDDMGTNCARVERNILSECQKDPPRPVECLLTTRSYRINTAAGERISVLATTE